MNYLRHVSGANQVDVADTTLGGRIARKNQHASRELLWKYLPLLRGIGFVTCGNVPVTRIIVSRRRLLDINDALAQVLVSDRVLDVDEVLAFGWGRVRVHGRMGRVGFPAAGGNGREVILGIRAGTTDRNRVS